MRCLYLLTLGLAAGCTSAEVPLDAAATVPLDAGARADSGPGLDAGDAHAEADSGVEADAGPDLDSGVEADAAPTLDGGMSSSLKPLPSGVFESGAGLRSPDGDVVGQRHPGPARGVMIKAPWNLCDEACLLQTIERQLDAAHARGLQASLIVPDAFNTPERVLSQCATFEYTFRGTVSRMCLPWDPDYQREKANLLRLLGQRFDEHPALAYVYFTGACATNGAEGHCRVDERDFEAAGFTEQRLVQAYVDIMDVQLEAFVNTPIAFEVHTIFGRTEPWASLWEHTKRTGRVGIAAWWCAERLAVSGAETQPVWPLVQEAAQLSFTVCQTVGNFTSQPYRFSDPALGLDYGAEDDWDGTDSQRAFQETMDWAKGRQSHLGQDLASPFSVLEPWSQDLLNPAFASELSRW